MPPVARAFPGEPPVSRRPPRRSAQGGPDAGPGAPSPGLRPALLDALNEHAIVSVADLQGTIVYANDQFCRISGYSREELLGQSHRLLKSGQHDPAFYETLWRTISSGQVWHGELTNRRKDGSLYWVQSTIVPVLDAQGLPTRYVSLRTDISQQKRLEHEARHSEEFLRRLTEAFGLGVLVADPKGRCQFASEEALRLLHMAREQVVGWSVHGLFTELSKDPPSARHGRADRREPLWRPGRYRATIVATERRPLPVVIHVTALRESERRTGTVIHFRDDSDERRALANARRERRLAEKADQAKTTFVAQLSHEIRTPLAGILGLVRLARSEPEGSPRVQDYLRRIEHSAEALGALVGDVLDISRLEAGQFPLNEAAFDLPALVHAVWEAHAVPAAQKHIRLELALAPDLPRHVLGDAMRVRQILVNYLANAIKFTAEGQVTLRVQRSDPVGIRLEVSDTGIGIAPAVLRRLFRPFSQADAATASRFGGTGLGLSICKQLARQMGGSVGASSTADHGSTFWAELPLATAEGGPHVAPSPPDLPPLNLQVLVAEDDDVNLLIVTTMLESWGCQVMGVRNGQQALEALAAAAPLPDAVLLDLNMPVMGGLEAARQIRHRFGAQRLPMVGMTAVGLAHEREDCLGAGMVGYLIKPLTPAALHAALAPAPAQR